MKNKLIAALMFGSCAFYAAQDVSAMAAAPTATVNLTATVPAAFNLAIVAAGLGAQNLELLEANGTLKAQQDRTITYAFADGIPLNVTVTSANGVFELRDRAGANQVAYEITANGRGPGVPMQYAQQHLVTAGANGLEFVFNIPNVPAAAAAAPVAYEDVVTITFAP